MGRVGSCIHSNILWIFIGLRDHSYYDTHCTIMFKKPNIPAPTSSSQMMTIGDTYFEITDSLIVDEVILL